MHIDKRLVFVSLIIGLLAVAFWTGSRYPALNEKALMAGDTDITGLAFDTLVDIPADASPVLGILYNGINWTWTNRQGMTFGVLLAGALMTLLTLLQRRAFKGRFANTLLGVLVGAPLGVCVNCATPIAQGLYDGGSRRETMLAAMMSSPTLNVIVLSMLFSLLPFYMAGIKIILTVAFLLIGIPLLVRYIPVTDDRAFEAHAASALKNLSSGTVEIGEAGGWNKALRWTVLHYLRNLWHVIRTAVPLMLLAGFLGAALITLLPLDALAGAMPDTSRSGMLLAMGAVALIGVFLPVPMAFDVIVVIVLIQAGLPIKYAMALLFTLGIFSIYPFFLIWKRLSPKLAVSLFLILAGLGVVAGGAAHGVYKWNRARWHGVIVETLTQFEGGPVRNRIDRTRQGEPDEALISRLSSEAVQPEDIAVAGSRNIEVAFTPFQPKQGTGDTLFSRFSGPQYGLNEDDNFSVLRSIHPWMQFRGIAAGDVHNDGRTDVVITSDIGLGLYAAQQAGGYVQQNIDIPLLNDVFIPNAALVDLDNDGWLDLYFSTYRRGNYVVYNQEGRFAVEHMKALPNHKDAMLTAAAAFGDLDNDGDLDIVFGNWSPSSPPPPGYPDPMHNVWLENQEGAFTLHDLEGIPGETFNTLLSDFNNDGHTDLIVTNDHNGPDLYYTGSGDGALQLITRDDGLIPYTPDKTMSVTTADIDNDLIPEIYSVQNAWDEADKKMVTPDHICADEKDPDAHRNCLFMMRFREQFMNHRHNIDHCLNLDERTYRRDCILMYVWQEAVFGGNPEGLNEMPVGWEDAVFMGRYLALINRDGKDSKSYMQDIVRSGALPQRRQINVLLKQTDDGRFEDIAAEMGLDKAGWAWNARFADVNNDEWQDIYIVNNDFITRRRSSNAFFLNRQGQSFRKAAGESGLTSYMDALSYTYIDMDHDGDLDMISVPSVGPVRVHGNNTTNGHAIAFALRDGIGNRFGIGCKIIIHYGPDGTRHQMRELQASGGFISFDAPIAHFGLGVFEQISLVEIIWSTGERSVIDQAFPAGGLYTISRMAR